MTVERATEIDDLRANVRRFLQERSPEAAVRAEMVGTRGFDPALWKELAADVELVGIDVPERWGGHGHGPVELGVVLEEMGRGGLSSPYFGTAVLAAHCLAAAGDEDTAGRYLPQLITGALTSTVAFGEPLGWWADPAGGARATRRAGHWRIDGGIDYVVDGHTAGTRPRHGADRGRHHDVRDGRRRCRSRPHPGDHPRRHLQAGTAAAAGGAGAARGGGGRGGAGGDRGAGAGRVGAGCRAGGRAGRTLEMAVEHVGSRTQFDRPVGSFQAVKHRCAEQYLDVETARAATGLAARAAEEGHPRRSAYASLANAHCSDMFVTVATESLHLHGGLGFTWEHAAHLYFRRARSSAVSFGDPRFHRERFMQEIES